MMALAEAKAHVARAMEMQQVIQAAVRLISDEDMHLDGQEFTEARIAVSELFWNLMTVLG